MYIHWVSYMYELHALALSFLKVVYVSSILLLQNQNIAPEYISLHVVVDYQGPNRMASQTTQSSLKFKSLWKMKNMLELDCWAWVLPGWDVVMMLTACELRKRL